MIKYTLAITACLLAFPALACTSVNGLPDTSPGCTPGAVDPHVTQANIHQTICVPGYTKTVRPPVEVTNKIKRERMHAYGMDGQPMKGAELDHEISLELAGAPADVRNLWPEPYAGEYGARVKDKVENAAHRLVCQNKMPLAEAQRKIASDWIAFYHELKAKGEIR